MVAKSPFKPLPPGEADICRRVARIREEGGLKQTQFAEKLGLTVDRLINIENARVSLKAGLGFAICHMFDVSQLWLAFGIDPPKPFLRIEAPFGLDDTLFSAAVKELRSDLDLRRGWLIDSTNAHHNDSVTENMFYAEYVANIARRLASHVPPRLRHEFLQRLDLHIKKLLIDLQKTKLLIDLQKTTEKLDKRAHRSKAK